jgi:hypothetical protein
LGLRLPLAPLPLCQERRALEAQIKQLDTTIPKGQYRHRLGKLIEK